LAFKTEFEDPAFSICEWTAATQDSDGVWQHGYPTYTERFLEFVQRVSASDLMDTEYLDHLEHWMVHGEAIPSAIERADLSLLRAIVTYLIRQERFGDGNWESSVKDGSFLAVLKRLEELTQ